MVKYVLKLGLAGMTHYQLKAFAQSVADMMNGNLNYVTPNPTLLVLGGLITDFSDALTAWGTFPENRGNTLQHADVLTTRDALEVGLTTLAGYVFNTTPYDRDAFLSGGWLVKRLSTPVGLVGPVRDFHQVFNGLVPSGAVKLKWKTPAGVNRKAIDVYRVMRSLTADINAATQIGLTSRATFTDLSAADRPSNFYWIIPVCTAGFGGVADVVQGYPQGPVVS